MMEKEIKKSLNNKKIEYLQITENAILAIKDKISVKNNSIIGIKVGI